MRLLIDDCVMDMREIKFGHRPYLVVSYQVVCYYAGERGGGRAADQTETRVACYQMVCYQVTGYRLAD
jgi:hypothetical protein